MGSQQTHPIKLKTINFHQSSDYYININTLYQHNISTQYINTPPTHHIIMLSITRNRLFTKSITSSFRTFTSSSTILNTSNPIKTASSLSEVKGPENLIGPGAKEGTFPTDLDQATGLERLELLGKLEGIEVFDTKPLDSSRKGTMMDPIIIESFDDYRYVGCTGSPADSHVIEWLKPTVDKVARCWECGSVYKLKPVGVPQDEHH